METAESERVEVEEYIVHRWWMQGVDKADRWEWKNLVSNGSRPAKEGLAYSKNLSFAVTQAS